MTSKKIKRPRIVGLHLWAVKAADLAQLWITTTTRSMPKAFEKAEKFIDKNFGSDDHPIKLVEYHGTIDV